MTGNSARRRLEKTGLWFIATVMTVFSIYFIAEGLKVQVWRPDSIYYGTDFSWKLRTEGRWLVYLLFDAIKLLPSSAIWVAGLVLHCLFFFYATLCATRNLILASVFALLALQFMPIVSQSLWPGYSFCGGLTLGLAVLLHRHVKMQLFFPLLGVLMGGAYQHYYFLLPLLYFDVIVNTEERWLPKFVEMAFWWVLGFCLGVLASFIILYLISNRYYYIQPHRWREPNPVTSISDLANNLAEYAATFARDLKNVFQGYFFAALYATLVAVCLLGRKVRYLLAVLSMCSIIVFSLYAALLPIGTSIPERATLPVFAGFFMITYVLGNESRIRSLVAGICLFAVFLVYFQINSGNLKWYTTVTDTYVADLNALAENAAADNLKLVVAKGVAGNYQRYIESVENLPIPRIMEPYLSVEHPEEWDYRWRAAVLESEFETVSFCQSKEDKGVCAQIQGSVDWDRCDGSHPHICVHPTDVHSLVVVSLK